MPDYIVAFAGSANPAQTPVNINGWLGASQSYPATRGGVTFGRTAGTADSTLYNDSGTWPVAGVPEELRGAWRSNNNAATPMKIRVDLPGGAGEYKLWLLIPYARFSKTGLVVTDGVGGSTLVSQEGLLIETPIPDWTTGPTAVLDAANNIVTVKTGSGTPAIDYATLVPHTVTFTANHMEIILDSSTISFYFSVLSAVAFEKILPSGLSPSTIAYYRRLANLSR